ncbi:MAG TPA: methyltransferase [Candidatus Paceibacterota bacterium]|nr:methyltransferase [Candidatus Paceibacterota bacterium]
MNEVKIEKFNIDGSGHVRLDGRDFHIWNALPEEVVAIEITAKKKGKREAKVTNHLSASPLRIAPLEDHFTSCSPWQILSLQDEQKFKKEIALRVFKDLPEVSSLLASNDPFTNSVRQNYRHKMEYHVYTDDENNFHLGFFGRTEKKKIPCGECALATKALNDLATKIISWLDQVKFPRPLLKTIIVRSNTKGEAIAALFAKTKEIDPLLNSPFPNLTIYYSNPKSPASVADETLVEAKQNTLKETLCGIEFTYGIMSFFQINPQVFEEALRDISEFIEEGSSVVDFYSGVGTIGLSLKGKVRDLVLVEENKDAVAFAKQNILENNIKNAEAYLGQAHDLREYISRDKILIIDPPRGGLHPKVIKKILSEKPPRIIYLSCNIESQARDLKELEEGYDPIFARLYNFFPMTPHVESLVILDRRTDIL